jgi:uncharacterized protein GlcG (DUF336 family)
MKSLHQLILSSVLLTPLLVFAEAEIPDVITVKKISMELAAEIATKAVKTCRDQGYQVSAVVVDRSGNMQVAMRDVHASRFTLQIAEEKANAVILGGVSSGEIRKNRADIRQELNHVDGLLIMRGGLPIRAAGSIIGAVGVSGAPGGDKDEICAQKALDTVQERLDFIE